jgi:CO/xanthine dehydrogenase Mo-binding subunit
MTATLIGAPLPRPDALGKVTGATRYPADLIRPEMLQLKVVFAGRPHARLRSIDPSAALALPGVVAVLTASDVPYNAHGLIEDDQPVLCADVVRFEGDKVALVVAETAEAAETAARLVAVSYEDLPGVFDPCAAMAPDAPLVHAAKGTNILLHRPIRKGDVGRGFADADVVLDGEFQTGWQEHAYLQPEAGIAYLDTAGRVVVETAGQWLHEDRKQIAKILRLPDDRVVVRYAAIGGAFGGREDLSCNTCSRWPPGNWSDRSRSAGLARSRSSPTTSGTRSVSAAAGGRHGTARSPPSKPGSSPTAALTPRPASR